MQLQKTLLLVPLAGVLVLLGASDKVTIKRTAIPHTDPASGQEMYVAYCASCHGKDAKGSGPAAPALKSQPADLTKLATRNDGKFPAMRVGAILRGQEELNAHGSSDMPVWGPVLASRATGASEVSIRIANLTDYLKSLQE